MKIVFAQGLYKYRFSQLQESPASCHTAAQQHRKATSHSAGPARGKGRPARPVSPVGDSQASTLQNRTCPGGC